MTINVQMLNLSYFRVNHKSADLKVNIFDMAGHPIFYEVSALS